MVTPSQILAFLFIFHATTHSALADLSTDCTTMAAGLGHERSPASLSQNCAQAIFSSANPRQISTSLNGLFSVAGYKNVLSFQSNLKQTHYDFIAGPNSSLNQVLSVSLASANKQIWVLDQNTNGVTEIKVFGSKFGGNLIPSRTYVDSKLQGAASLQVSSDGSEVALWYPTTSTIQVMSTAMPANQQFNKLNLDWKRTISAEAVANYQLSSLYWNSVSHHFVLINNNFDTAYVLGDLPQSGSAGVVSTRALYKNAAFSQVSWSAQNNALTASFKDGTVSVLDQAN